MCIWTDYCHRLPQYLLIYYIFFPVLEWNGKTRDNTSERIPKRCGKYHGCELGPWRPHKLCCRYGEFPLHDILASILGYEDMYICKNWLYLVLKLFIISGGNYSQTSDQ